MRYTTPRNALLLAGLVVLTGTAVDASAAYVDRVLSQLAPGLCAANNPANEQYLRYLLSGLRNAGTANVSVVCSKVGDDLTGASMTQAYVYLLNNKATEGTATCTLASGSPYYGQVSYTKTVTVAAGLEGAAVWTTSDYGTSADNQWVNIQCSLPPGWTMQEVGSAFAEYTQA